MTVYADNRRVRFDYALLDTLSAGLELTGAETKSVRRGSVSLDGAHVSVRGGEAYLLNAFIAPYQPGNLSNDPDERRPRRLLLARGEIARLAEAEGTKGLTIVPVSLYNKGRFVKLDIAIARGKKHFDKRESIKRRDIERELKQGR